MIFICLYFYVIGYIGHLASRHSDVLSDCSPVLTNSQAESIEKEKSSTPQTIIAVKEEIDPELSIPKTSVPNYQTSVVKQTPVKFTDTKKIIRFKGN